MVSDEAARKTAQAYAEYLDTHNKFAHSDRSQRNNCGENLAYYSNLNGMLTTDHATQAWYNEIKDYDYKGFNAATFHKVGHFT